MCLTRIDRENGIPRKHTKRRIITAAGIVVFAKVRVRHQKISDPQSQSNTILQKKNSELYLPSAVHHFGEIDIVNNTFCTVFVHTDFTKRQILISHTMCQIDDNFFFTPIQICFHEMDHF